MPHLMTVQQAAPGGQEVVWDSSGLERPWKVSSGGEKNPVDQGSRPQLAPLVEYTLMTRPWGFTTRHVLITLPPARAPVARR